MNKMTDTKHESLTLTIKDFNNQFNIENKTIVSFLTKNISDFQNDFDKWLEKKSLGFIDNSFFRFPWKNVSENISFGNETKSAEEVKSVINFVGLTGYESHFSIQESYGFNFRIALARSILRGFSLVILNNSLKNIKNNYKKEIFNLLKTSTQKFEISFFLLTDSVEDAVMVSDKVIFLDKDYKIQELVIQNLDSQNPAELSKLISEVYSKSNLLNL